MITTLPKPEADNLAKTHRCGECGGRLSVAWGGTWGLSQYVLRCLNVQDPTCLEHQTIKRGRDSRKLYNVETKTWEEYDIMTQRPIDQETALALPSTRDGMLARVEAAFKSSMFPGRELAPALKDVIVVVAMAYRLDPLMGEIMPYQGRPYITIAGRRRLDNHAGHRPSIRFRPLNREELDYYTLFEVLNANDFAVVCILEEAGQVVEGFGRVLASERKADRQGSSHLPLVQRTLEMAQKRAERRAREMAYGPVPIPMELSGVQVLQEGDVVEGEIMRDFGPTEAAEPPSDAEVPPTSPGTGEAPQPPLQAQSEASSDGADSPERPDLEQRLWEVCEAAGQTYTKVCKAALTVTLAQWLAQGKSPADAITRFGKILNLDLSQMEV